MPNRIIAGLTGPARGEAVALVRDADGDRRSGGLDRRTRGADRRGRGRARDRHRRRPHGGGGAMDALRPVRAAGTGAWMVAPATRGTWGRWEARDPLVAPALARDLAGFMWGPLPTLVVLSLLTGLIAGISAGRFLALYHAELLVIRALVDALLRQVLPLVIGVFAASGVAVAMRDAARRDASPARSTRWRR
ncbi:hypothetical protein AB5I41_12155 [Sphingomonas sp. MMS24-JH45]